MLNVSIKKKINSLACSSPKANKCLFVRFVGALQGKNVHPLPRPSGGSQEGAEFHEASYRKKSLNLP